MQTHKDLPSTDSTEIENLRQRLRRHSLDEQDFLLLDRLLGSFLTLIDLLHRKDASIRCLKRWLFGPSSDKRASAKQQPSASSSDSLTVPASASESAPADSSTEPKRRPRGHGRRGSASYTGAQVGSCEDPTLKPGDRCPHCPGHLYDTHAPTMFIRVTGQPIVGATRYVQQV